MACVRLTVTGRVQGVGFRAYVRDGARGLGVRGWVRNRANGSVEVLACGSEAALEALIRQVAKGPPGAHVAGMEREMAGEWRGSEGFVVRYDET
ncbi:acylphosphatase [Acidiferrobacter sp.]|uniref:acylphosphatase n=1 Tax=Acidiferrobacter sp. TaxID=1872107 RepID=UPI002633D4FB|nr:acylphosphatase [Acidiferrobacter sp.]